MKRLFAVTMLLTLLAAPAVARADSPLPEPRKVTSVEGITEYELGNGLKVLLFPDATKPTVTVNITYLVGSRHEGYGETGMAHLLEHLMFKGTPKNPDVWKALQNHGANFNGTTWFDRTNYFETLAATPENLEFALQLEADRMVNSHIAQKDLDSEFSVVRNEFESNENDPLNILSERMQQTAFLWHNYGNPTIGSREDIERVPIHRLRAFYETYYQPDNAILVVAGQFDPAKTLTRINELYGSIPRPKRTINPTYTVEPAQDGEREVVLRRVGDVQAVGCVYHICAGAHTDMPALDVMEHVLTADQTGRLYKALVEPQLAVSVRGSAYSLAEPGMLEFLAEVRNDKPLAEVRRVMMETLDGFAGTEITRDEVERAKNLYAKQFDQSMNDPNRIAVMLSEFAAQGDWRLLFLYRDRVAQVTPDDVKRVAATYLRPTNRTIGMFIPVKSPDRVTVPPTPELASMLKDYKGREALASGETIEATPDAIEARTLRGSLPVGLKTVMLPKKTRGQKVTVHMTLRFGTEADFKNRVEAADMLGSMLSNGTAKRTKRQLQDELDKLKATVRINSAQAGSITVSGETIRKNLPATLDLIAEMLRESNFPEKEFEKLRKRQLAQLEQSATEPTVLASLEMRRRMVPVAKDDVRYVPTVGEQIERITAVKLEDVKKLHGELLGAGQGEVSVVGDFDEKEVAGQLQKLFGDWKSSKKFERIAMPHFPTKADLIVIDTPDKQNALFGMAMNIPIRDDDPDYPAMMMANYILGGNANSRLINRIRQKEGLSYGTGSRFEASSLDRTGSFMVFGICAPQNSEKALTCAREEIDKLLKDGVSQKELDEARKGYLDQFKVSLAEDRRIAPMLARQTYLGRTMKFTSEQLDKIAKLSTDDVNAAARKYLKPGELVAVRAGDFSAKTKTSEPEPDKDAAKVPDKATDAKQPAPGDKGA